MLEGRSSARDRFEWDDGDSDRCDPNVRRLLDVVLRLTRDDVLRWSRIGVREAAPTSHDAVDIPGVLRFRTHTSSSKTRSSLKLDIIFMDWSPVAIIRLCVTGERTDVSVHRVPRDLGPLGRLLRCILGGDVEVTRPEVLSTAVSIVDEVETEHAWASRSS